MAKANDLVGQTFGQTTVTGRAESNAKGNTRWHCRCACGNEHVAMGYSLTGGHTRSCGCLQRKSVVERNQKHGLTGTPEYIAWKGMKTRCTNPNEPGWMNYGGRGITVDPLWMDSFPAFLEHIGPRPSSRHSLDRIDVDGNYEPGNVRWALRGEQNTNRRDTVFVEVRGERLKLKEAAAKYGLPVRVLRIRLLNGMDPETACTQPLRVTKRTKVTTADPA